MNFNKIHTCCDLKKTERKSENFGKFLKLFMNN